MNEHESNSFNIDLIKSDIEKHNERIQKLEILIKNHDEILKSVKKKQFAGSFMFYLITALLLSVAIISAITSVKTDLADTYNNVYEQLEDQGGN